MKITLINPPWYFKRGLTNLSQNLGLGYIAAYLLEHGHTVNIIDALAEGHDLEKDGRNCYISTNHEFFEEKSY